MKTHAIAYTKTYTYVICALFAALTAVGAFIKIPLPLIPFTLQFLFVALSGVLLGAKRGLISQLLYIGIGLAGVPVFAEGGGISYIFQPSFGYLIGFAAAAYLIGRLMESKTSSIRSIFLSTFIGLLLVYLIGVIYMYFIVNLYLSKEITLWKAIYAGAVTCLPADLLLCLLTGLAGTKLVPILKRQQLIS